jgi:hypothetical protein
MIKTLPQQEQKLAVQRKVDNVLGTLCFIGLLVAGAAVMAVGPMQVTSTTTIDTSTLIDVPAMIGYANPLIVGLGGLVVLAGGIALAKGTLRFAANMLSNIGL